jgi:hypothetical protein
MGSRSLERTKNISIEEFKMKKRYVLILALTGLVLAAACKSSPPAPPPQANSNVPEWASEFPPEDVLWGIGSAKQSTENMSMSIAEARARQSISYQLVTIARGMITMYDRDAGTTGSEASSHLAEEVARQLTSSQLNGAMPINRWKAPDGTWWYMVQYGKSAASQEIADVFNNEAAQFAEYKAMEAFKLADAELAKFNEKPEPVTE